MTKRLIVAGSLILLALLSGCARVSAGHVGVMSTLTGSNRGLADVAVGPAWVPFNLFNESVMEYPIFVQTAVWTHNKDEGHPVNEEVTFTNHDNMQIAADISLAYSLDPAKVPAFYLKFRSNDLDGFTHGFLRNLAREKFDTVAGHYTVEQIMGDNAAFLGEVRRMIQQEITPYGVKLEQFGFIGAPRPPREVIAGITAKVQANQIALQKQNELLQSQADAAKEVAEAEGHAKAVLTNAEAQATANRRLAESITPTLVEYEKILKWNGALPQVQSGAGGLMLSLPSK